MCSGSTTEQLGVVAPKATTKATCVVGRMFAGADSLDASPEGQSQRVVDAAQKAAVGARRQRSTGCCAMPARCQKRRAQATHPPTVRPELVATTANAVWSSDHQAARPGEVVMNLPRCWTAPRRVVGWMLVHRGRVRTPGRVTVPPDLRQEGHRQTLAVDMSRRMLRALRMSAVSVGVELESVEGDIANLATRRKFDLILLLDSTLNMLDPERQESCIRGCAERLDADGLLLIQSYNAMSQMFSGEAVYGVTEHGDGTVVARIFRMDDGIRLSGSIYVVPTEGNRTRICSETVPIRHETMMEMVVRAGLKVMHCYADWDSSDLSHDSPQGIYVVGQNLVASGR